MKLVVFGDAHIDSKEKATEIAKFLEAMEGKKILCLGDLFDTEEDYRKYRKLVPVEKISVWLKGNHEYWAELPERVEIGNFIFTHGHKLLPTWPIEEIFIKMTPLSKKSGFYTPVTRVGKFFEGTGIARFFARVAVNVAELSLKKEKKVHIIGHLHRLVVGKKIIVVPKFPYFAEIQRKKMVIKKFFSKNKNKGALSGEEYRQGVIVKISLRELLE